MLRLIETFGTKTLAALCSMLIAVLISAPESPAESIYRWTDEKGGEHFSTSPENRGQKPAALPEIGRENIDERIEKIQKDTPDNCEAHGGVDCSQGADVDGSVICLDGYKLALLPYRFHCLSVKLSAQVLAAQKDSRQYTVLADHSELLEALKRREKPLRITVRNLSPVKAYGVSVSLQLPSRAQLPAPGPRSIAPYKMAEYELIIDNWTEVGEIKDLARPEVRVSCTNCRRVRVTGRW